MFRLSFDSTVVEVVRQGILRWLGYVVRKSDDDFVRRRGGLTLKVVEEEEGQGKLGKI